MPIELILLLVLIGAGTGSISALIAVAPTLIAVPTLYFFLPVFGVSFDDVILPVIATCLTAFMPTHLYAWIKSMKLNVVDFQCLINFTPGIVMGAVVGAQLLSLITPLIFKIAFSTISIFAILNVIFGVKINNIRDVNMNKFAQLPIGLLIGVASLLSGNCSQVLVGYLYAINNTHFSQRQGTIEGVAAFASIAAMVGFIYPAKAIDSLDFFGFSGAIHLPSVLILAISHFFFYWLCQGRGNKLDKSVLSIGFVIFLACSLMRLWI